MLVNRAVYVMLLAGLVVSSTLALPAAFAEEKQSTFFVKGKGQLEEGNYVEAIEEFRKVLLRDPDHEETHFLMGRAFEETGQELQAIDSYSEVARINPLNLKAQIRLGDLHRSRLKLDKAKEHYRNVITLMPETPEPYLAMAQISLQLGDRKEAEKFYKNYLEREPSSGVGHFEYARLLYARALKVDGPESAEMMGKVREHFLAAKENDPDLIEAYSWLASLSSARGLYNEAIQYCQEGLARKNSAALRIKLAETYFNMDDPAAALPHIERALRIEKDNEDAIQLRERILARKAQKERE